MDIQNLVPVDYSNQRVLTTAQVAKGLDCSVDLLKMLFKNHKGEFEEGIHFFNVKGGSLRVLKERLSQVKNLYLPSSPLIGKFASHALLWTEQGVARLSKLIDTPQAWAMMDKLKIDYFAVEDAEKPAMTPQVFDKVGYIDDKGTAWFNAEFVARGLGWVDYQEKFSATSGGKTYEVIRWARVNGYLREFGFDKEVGKDDFLPENIVYRLAMKANNETAVQFQIKIANEILPSIRKHGFYSVNEPVETSLFPDEEPVKKVRRRPTPELAVVYAVLLSNMLVKIGMTRDLTARMKDLQKETKADILAWVSTPFMTRDETALLERSLKVKFFDKNKGGEFYDVDFDTVKAALISPDDKFNKLLTLAREMEPSPEKNQLLLQAATLLK